MTKHSHRLWRMSLVCALALSSMIAYAQNIDMDRLQIVVVGDAKKIADTLKQFRQVEIFDSEGKPITSP